MNQYGAGFVLSAVDRASGVFKQVGNQFGNLVSRITGGSADIKRDLKFVGWGTAGLAASGILLKKGFINLGMAAGKYTENLDRIGQMLNLTSDQQEQVGRQMERIGARSGGLDQASASMLGLVRETGDLDVAMRLLPQAIGLAESSYGDLDASMGSKVLTDAVKLWKLQGKEVDNLGDKIQVFTKLARGVKNGELPEVFTGSARAAIGAGQGIDETLIAIGLMRRALPSTEMAVRAFSMGMARLGSAPIQEKLKESLGIEVVDKKTGAFKKASDLFVEMSARLADMDQAQAKTTLTGIFGGARSPAMIGVIGLMDQMKNGVKGTNGELLKGPALIRDWRNQLNASQGALAAAEKRAGNTLPKALEDLGNTWRTVKVQLGEAIAPMLVSFLKDLSKNVEKVSKWLNELSPESRKMIANFTLWSTAIIGVGSSLLFLRGIGGMALKLLFGFGGLKSIFGGGAVAAKGLGSAVAGVGTKAVVAGGGLRGLFGLSRLFTLMGGPWTLAAVGLGYALAELISSEAGQKFIKSTLKQMEDADKKINKMIGRASPWVKREEEKNIILKPGMVPIKGMHAVEAITRNKTGEPISSLRVDMATIGSQRQRVDMLEAALAKAGRSGQIRRFTPERRRQIAMEVDRAPTTAIAEARLSRTGLGRRRAASLIEQAARGAPGQKTSEGMPMAEAPMTTKKLAELIDAVKKLGDRPVVVQMDAEAVARKVKDSGTFSGNYTLDGAVVPL
jgi:TP901 family phage tail tape measure protein